MSRIKAVDVYLGYFEFVQCRVAAFVSGAVLAITEQGLCNQQQEQVVKYSRQFEKLLKGHIKKKGFSIKKAKVNFMVYWRDEEKGTEVLVAPPRLLLVR